MSLDDFDLGAVPTQEDDEYEFKSSRTKTDALKIKLAQAASGFANSGGGYFIAGIDDVTGLADGGLARNVGRQSLRDWVDTVLRSIEPPVRYEVALIDNAAERGNVDPGRVLLVLRICQSHAGPHMAPDHKYYIRAGAHTVPARHFVVEAIRAKRHVEQPRLTHVFRVKPGGTWALQLGLVALTDAPALDVSVLITPWPSLLERRQDNSPITVSVVSREHALYLDVAAIPFDDTDMQKQFGSLSKLDVRYSDLLGRPYSYCVKLDAADILAGASDEGPQIARELTNIQRLIRECGKFR
jgi:hypothetical protein